MSNQKDLFIFAGEASGDLLGSELIKSLLQKKSDLQIEAVAGPLMRTFSISSFLKTELFQVMGFIDVIKALPKLSSYFKTIKNHLLKNPPKILILIDYPGFNLRLAKALKKAKFPSPIIQYVCPTIWAWKKNRIKTMNAYLDTLFCLFPFEPSYFTSSLKAFYVGHPLSHKILPASSTERDNLILIFPGSRIKEIERNFSLQLEATLQANTAHYKIGISYASNEIKLLLEKKIAAIDKKNIFLFHSKDNYSWMKKAKASLATSGTITLELALHNLPSIVIYKISLLDTFLAKHLFKIKLPYYCIVNYITNQLVFPEFYGPKIPLEKVSSLLKSFIENKEARLLYQDKTRLARQALEASQIIEDPAYLVLKQLN